MLQDGHKTTESQNLQSGTSLQTVKVLLNPHESITCQKQWLVFDLRVDGLDQLATYECTQDETFQLISMCEAEQPKLTDLLCTFAIHCKFSHSERLKRWLITLGNLESTCTPEETDTKLQYLVEQI